MTWLNPAAFVGLLALAVPVFVHLFGRRMARRQRFPSLRLLVDSRPTPVARSRPSDLLLLGIRCAVVLAATLALAQPRWSSAARIRDASLPTRLILVDTSASMRRLTSGGATLLQEAQSITERLIDSSSAALVVETPHPGSSMAGAASWLQNRSGLRELVVISDFQAGSIHDGHLAAIAPGVGTKFVRVPFAGSIAAAHTVNGVLVETTAAATAATWPLPGADSLPTVTIAAADEDRDAVRRLIAAVRALLSPAGGSHKVTVVFPGASARAELLAQAARLDSAWQGDFMMALARDRVLRSVAHPARVVPSCETSGGVIVANWMDQPVATVARGPNGLLVFTCVEPGTVAAAGLIAGIESALSGSPAMSELEPGFLPDETLRRWERPPTEVSPHGPEETSPDGRWLWLLALTLLVAEEWLRRRGARRETRPSSEVRHERVA